MANSTEKMPIINSWGKALYVTKVHRQHSGAKVVFSAEGARTIGHPLAKKVNLQPDLIPFTKINSK